MDAIDEALKAEREARAALVSALRGPPPRAPFLPPASLRNQVLAGSHWLAGLIAALLLGADLLGDRRFIHVALGFLLLVGSTALFRLLLSVSLWRGGVLTSAELIEDEIVERHNLRNGRIVDTVYSHRARVRFTDRAGRICDGVFRTAEVTELAGPLAAHLDLVYVPGRWLRPWQGVVVLRGDELCTCAFVRPGGSTAAHTIAEYVQIAAVFAVTLASYMEVPGVAYVVHRLHFWLTGSY